MKNELIDTTLLDLETKDIVSQAISEKDPKKVKDLTDLFNVSINKKNMVRITKLNDLLDKTTDQAIERFEKQPDQFSNKELIDYMNAVSNISDRAVNNLKAANDAPPIQLNQQNNVSINVGGTNINELTRESRQRILDAVNSVLQQSNNIVEGEIKHEQVPAEVDRQQDNTIQG